MHQDGSEAAITRSSAAKISRAVQSHRSKALSPQRAGPRSRAMQQRAPGRSAKSPRANVAVGGANGRQGQVNSVVELSLLRASTVSHLPPPNTQRWVVRRNAAVVAAVRSGTITIEEALRRYQLTEEEFLSWLRAFEAHGLAGLRATRIQQYRGSRRPRGPRSRRCGHRGFERPASTALTVLSRLPAGLNLVSSLTFVAKISSSRLITRSGWHTCITEQPAGRPHRPARNQLPIEFVTICRRPKSIFSRSDDA